MADAGKGASTSGQDEDVSQLVKDPEKIKVLMRRDPRFIKRMITKEIEQINETIRTHITPNLERLNTSIASKSELREHLTKQIDTEMGNVRNLEAEARALISKTRHTAGTLVRKTAVQRVEEARGFSVTTPTITILKGSPSATKTKPPGDP
ncbi:hypothetical protein GPECTOR_472g397 [Gonium pectorale]|uniref:Uncharacterized protein n=1 Tax=Gonium pectorale TaxID=33097 RepID=A0A150FUY0_GONPE|nr:hypothetical protein GPECTOR_472g397 [Gonium pectorale]|eukprot:KXZ41431.1 hypothetical protein GPECTOR_472g397 [Gonium pectorale]